VGRVFERKKTLLMITTKKKDFKFPLHPWNMNEKCGISEAMRILIISLG
jgi:hypothetical protein